MHRWLMLVFCRMCTQPTCQASSIADQSTPAEKIAQAGDKQLRLHNTMTKQLEAVTAREGTDNTIAMYVCGPTTYDFSHIGGIIQGLARRKTCFFERNSVAYPVIDPRSCKKVYGILLI